MELDRLLTALEDYLGPLVSPIGGSVQVSLDPWDTLELLRTGPGKWRVILTPEGEEPVEDFGAGGWVRGSLVAYVQVHTGLAVPKGKSLHRSTPSRPTSALGVAAAVRGLLRGVMFEDAEVSQCHGLMFDGAEWFTDSTEERQQWRVRALRFSTFYLLDGAVSGTNVPTVVGQYLHLPTPTGTLRARMVYVDATASPTVRLFVEGAYLYVRHSGGTHRVRLLALET